MSVLPRICITTAHKLLLAGCLAAFAPACASFAATANAPEKNSGAVTIGFDQVTNGAFTHYVESGFTIKAPLSSGWMGSTGYGDPAPFIDFKVPANIKTTANIYVTQNGTTFTFTSVEFYASDNPISYRFRGFLKGKLLYVDRGDTGSLFGNFRAFFAKKKSAKTLIDKLEITMADASSIGDTAGLDNIVLVPASSETN